MTTPKDSVPVDGIGENRERAPLRSALAASTPSDTLRALADRCEQQAPSRELDIAIATALGWTRHKLDPSLWRDPENDDGRPRNVRRYTTSLDAAVTLVPEDCGFMLGKYWRKEPGIWWSAHLAWGTSGDGAEVFDLRSPALALCAAALRAMAAMEPDHGN